MREVIELEHERRKLCLFSAADFTLGIIVGMVLFYGQQKNAPSLFDGGYEFRTVMQISDIMRAFKLNFLWLFAIFASFNILPLAPLQPIMLLRGAMSGFSVLYVMSYIGIKEAVQCILPQCFSILPLFLAFYVKTAENRKKKREEGKEPFSLTKSEFFLLTFWAAASAAAECALFRLLIFCLR